MDWEDLNKSRLSLNFLPDGEFGELFVEAEHRGFRGHSSGRFVCSELVEWSKSIERVAEHRLDVASIEGDHVSSQEIHVLLKFFPTGLHGYLGIDVLLIDPRLDCEAPGWRLQLSLRLGCAPAPVIMFAQRFRALVAGNRQEAELLCE